LNLRPLGPELASAHSDSLASRVSDNQVVDIIGGEDRTDTRNGTVTTPNQQPLVPPVSPRFVELPEQLLTMREVAERLRLCRATVYKLCAEGELAHVRIANAIRVAPADLSQFIAGRRRR